jgi:hypothetical protein
LLDAVETLLMRPTRPLAVANRYIRIDSAPHMWYRQGMGRNQVLQFDRLTMSRPLCDPIDLERVLSSLRQDGGSISNAYWEYASTAARPYASKTFYQIVVAAKRNKLLPYSNNNVARKQEQLDNADLDDLSDKYWDRFLSPKSNILTTTQDNASVKVKGNSLIVYDGDYTLTYQAGAANKPNAIVMDWLEWSCFN